MKKPSLFQAIEGWSLTKEGYQKPVLIKNLKTALKLYTLSQVDPKFDCEMKSTEFEDYCCEFSIARFPSSEMVLESFDRGFNAAVEAQTVSSSTKGNYRSALGRFMGWLVEQSWYKALFDTPPPRCIPRYVPAQRKPKPKHKGNRFYGLPYAEMPGQLTKELEKFKQFWSTPVASQHSVEWVEETPEALAQNQAAFMLNLEKRQRKLLEEGSPLDKPTVSPLAESKLDHFMQETSRFFGWLVKKGYPKEQLNLNLLTDRVLLQDYANWLIQERGTSYSATTSVLATALYVAKWLTYDQTRRRDWSDIEMVEDLRNYLGYYQKLYRKQKPELDEARWADTAITHDQARACTDYLYQCCAEYTNHESYYKTKSGPVKRCNDVKRATSAYVHSWKVYLIVKILTYVPIRQEEIRKLRIGSTLVRVTDHMGIERYAVKIKNHKNFSKTRKVRYYPLPTILTKDLDTWLEKVRPMIIQAPETLESWFEFWGHKLDDEESFRQRIANAKAGSFSRQKLKNVSAETTIKTLEKQLRAAIGQKAAWEAARANVVDNDHVFLTMGHTHKASFGKPCEECSHTSISSFVGNAVGRATKVLYGEPRFLPPHGFRNIGAAHQKKNSKGAHREAFSALEGHSLDIDNSYAAQVSRDYDLIYDIVDNWWE